MQAGAQQGDAIMAEAASREAGKQSRGGRKEGGERELTLIFLKIFNGSSKKFEYESCLKFKILHFHFRHIFI